MTGRIPGVTAKLAVLLVAAVGVTGLAASAASAQKIYSNIAHPLPGNWPSIGNEAYSNSEFGGLVKFAGTYRHGPKIAVGMSSWACVSGNWVNGNCSSKGMPRYSMPVRLNVYDVGPGNTVGSLVTSDEQTFAMPYRPSASRKCTGEEAGEWYQGSTATARRSRSASRWANR